MLVAITLATMSQAGASLIAHWTFETSLPTDAGPHLAELGIQAGIAQATGFHASGTTTYSNPVGNGSSESFSSNNWTTVGDYYQFRVDLTGFSNVAISWDQARSSTGPSDFSLQYSIDGSTFSVINNYTVLANSNPPAGPGAWSSLTYNPAFTFGLISLPAAADNQANVYVRLVSNATAASGGTNRIDNVRISVVPEPGTLSLLVVALAVVPRLRRR
jgi:hypothetical protein